MISLRRNLGRRFEPRRRRKGAASLVKGEGRTPHADSVLVYFQCQDDLSNELGRVEANGGKILTPKVPIGPWGFVAHVLDTEGNRIGLASPK